MADETILIVDDDRTFAQLCKGLLERADYQVLLAMHPADALAVIEKQPVDLLLTDVRMPVMDGFELISRAKELRPGLPVLVMTGYGSLETAIQALHRGVEGLILKPFERTAELVDAVRRVLEESRQRRDSARLQALRPLFDISEQLLAETSPQALDRQIIQQVSSLFHAAYAGLYRWNPQSEAMEVLRNVAGGQREIDPALQQRMLALLENVETSFFASQTEASPGAPACLAEIRAVMRAAGIDTIMLAPVRRASNAFILGACRTTGSQPFTEADLDMLLILARQASVAIENARLYSALRENMRQVEESQRALIHAEKMAAVGRLMASLAHEINNPLQSVRNCLHLAARPGIQPEQRSYYLDLTDTELERLVQTMRRMLDFSRPGGEEPRSAGVPEVIDQVLGILTPQLDALKIQVHVAYHGESRPVVMIPEQIQQVILNLLLNTMDALDDAHLPPGVGQKQIWIDVEYLPDNVRIRVEDNGSGVLPGMQERVFEPFVSTKQHGTGLGLAVSYGIMERHQGGLALVAPRHASGACFEMNLPFGVGTYDG